MSKRTKADPISVGIIMDGNRRWAKAHNLASKEGHSAGRTKAKEIARHAFSHGVGTLTLYAFSTENWNRSVTEVSYLMQLFSGALTQELEELLKEGIAVRFIGDFKRLPKKLRLSMESLEQRSAATTTGNTLVIALSYGGRAEILAATNHLLATGKKIVNEKDFSNALWSRGIQDPDIIIRTGGEKRLSNFLTWQSVYSELFFTDSFWPEFSNKEFDAILQDFTTRIRRRGK
jgi:undecaprenyl diphosphate synthase